jgi:hypothetical protein
VLANVSVKGESCFLREGDIAGQGGIGEFMQRVLSLMVFVAGLGLVVVWAGDVSAIKQSLEQSWNVKSVSVKDGHVFVDTDDRQITDQQYLAMVTEVCFLPVKNKQVLAGFSRLSIRNFAGRQGYTYESLAACDEVMKSTTSKVDVVILGKTHTLLKSEVRPLP